jgi:hypothetical protein
MSWLYIWVQLYHTTTQLYAPNFGKDNFFTSILFLIVVIHAVNHNMRKTL